MAFDASLQIGELAREFSVIGQNPTELDEGAHDGNIDLNGARAMQHARKTGDSLLGESVRAVPAAAASV